MMTRRVLLVLLTAAALDATSPVAECQSSTCLAFACPFYGTAYDQCPVTTGLPTVGNSTFGLNTFQMFPIFGPCGVDACPRVTILGPCIPPTGVPVPPFYGGPGTTGGPCAVTALQTYPAAFISEPPVSSPYPYNMATITIPIPGDASLIGASVCVQTFMVTSPSAGCPSWPLSGARQITIG